MQWHHTLLIACRLAHPLGRALVAMLGAAGSFSAEQQRRQQLFRHTLHRPRDSASKPVLVFAHKQDLPSALSAETIRDGLELPSLGGPCHVEGSTGNTGAGLYEGLDWLSATLAQQSAAL